MKYLIMCSNINTHKWPIMNDSLKELAQALSFTCIFFAHKKSRRKLIFAHKPLLTLTKSFLSPFWKFTWGCFYSNYKNHGKHKNAVKKTLEEASVKKRQDIPSDVMHLVWKNIPSAESWNWNISLNNTNCLIFNQIQQYLTNLMRFFEP